MDEPTPPADEPANEQRKQPDVKRWAIGILVVFALCCGAPGVWFFTSLGDDNGDGDSPESRRFDAERVCVEEFVPDQLRAPSTAEFSGVVVDVAGETYTVTGDVDAQNGFGAMIRSSFYCTVRLDGDSWRLQSATVR